MYSKGIPVIAVKLLIGEEKTEKTVNIGDTLTNLTIANPNGEDIARKIADEWKQKYRRRSAMMDELGRAGF